MDARYAAAYPELYRNHWWWRVREEILLAKIRRLSAAVGRPRILDVGCGAALLFDALAPFAEVAGIESDSAAVERSGRWRHHIVVGELDTSYQPTAPFDLILMLDLIEHVVEPEPLLRRAGEILAPGGHILVTVPAFDWLWTTHDEMNRHVRRYTLSTMTGTIERAGLALLEAGYMFQSLVVPKLLVRLRETLMRTPARVPRIPPAAINRALRAWYKAEYLVARRLPFGGSLFAVAAPASAASSRAQRRGS